MANLIREKSQTRIVLSENYQSAYYQNTIGLNINKDQPQVKQPVELPVIGTTSQLKKPIMDIM